MATAGTRPRRNRRGGRPDFDFGLDYVTPRQFAIPPTTGPTGTPILDNFNTGPNQVVDTRAGWKTGGIYYELWSSMSTDPAPTYAAGYVASNSWGTKFLDSEVWTVMGEWPDTNDGRLYARWDTSVRIGGTGYYLEFYNVNQNAWQFELRKQMADGSFVALTSTSVGVSVFSDARLISGNALALTCVGSTITAWLYSEAVGNTWSIVASATDTTWPGSGDIGMAGEDHKMIFDAFGGGGTLDLSGPRSDISVVRRTWAGR